MDRLIRFVRPSSPDEVVAKAALFLGLTAIAVTVIMVFAGGH